MDRFAISGTDLCKHYGDQASLKIVFSDIETELKASQMVVCRFVVNGIELTESDETKFASAKLSEVETLEFFVEQTFSLLINVTEGWIEAIPQLMANTEKVAELMRQTNFAQTIKPFYDLVENCELMVSSLSSLKDLGGGLFQNHQATWNEITCTVEKRLLEGYNFIEKKDYLGLADVLEYELIPCFESWLLTLRNVEAQLKENQDELKSKFHFEESENSGSMPWTFRSQ